MRLLIRRPRSAAFLATLRWPPLAVTARECQIGFLPAISIDRALSAGKFQFADEASPAPQRTTILVTRQEQKMQGIPTKMKAVLLKGHGGFDQLELLKTSSAIWPLSIECRCCPGDVWGAMPKPTTQIAGGEIILLDRVSEITLAGDHAMPDLQQIYQDDRLRVSEVIFTASRQTQEKIAF
jgi:hypothetical protein